MSDIGISIGIQGVSAYNQSLSSVDKKTKSTTDAIAGHFRDVNGKLRDANGKFVTEAKTGFQQVTSAMQGTISKIPVIGSSLSGLINPATAITALFAGAGAAATSFINKAAKAETVKASFEVLTGSVENAEKTLKSLAQFGASTPFELPEIQSAARKLIAFGTAGDQTTTVLRRIGDIAAGVDAPLGELSEIYGKIQVQGRLFAEDINQLTGRGIPIIQELAKQFGVADEEVKGLVTSGAIGFPQIEQAFKDLTSEGGKFFGLTEKLSGTFAGKLSTLNSNFGELQKRIGQLLLPAATKFLDISLKLVASFQDMNMFVYDNAEALGIAATAMIAFVAPSIISGLTAVITAIRGITLAQLSLNAAFAANPIGFVVIAAGLLTTAFIALYKRSQTLRAGISGLGSFFVELGSIIKNGFLKIIEGVGTSLQGLFDLDFGKIKEGIKTAISGSLDLIPATSFIKNGSRLAGAFSKGYQDRIDQELKETGTIGSDEEVETEGETKGAKGGKSFGEAFKKASLKAIDLSKITGATSLIKIDNAAPEQALGQETIATFTEGLLFAEEITRTGVENISNNFSSLYEVFDRMSEGAFDVGKALGASTDRALVFSKVFKDFKGGVFANSINIVGGAVQNLGRQLGEAVKTGKSVTEAIKGFVVDIVAAGLRYLGLFLLQGATTLGFPAGIPLAIGGALLLGASGFVSGLGSSGSSSQAAVSSPVDTVSGGISDGSVNQAQGAAIGLSNIQQQTNAQNTVLHIYMDGEEIGNQIQTNIETNNQLQGTGRN